MSIPSLSINSLINVQVNLSPAGAQAQNTSVALVLGNSPVINTVERIRYYTTLAGVASDFGTSAPEYFAAQAWFAQVPQPTEIAIGRWAQTATLGALICAPLSPSNQLIGSWTSITTGSFHINIDSVGAADVTGLDFHLATSLQGVAGVIQTALQSAFSDAATCVYNANFERFEIYGALTGASGSVTFMTAAGSGVDISNQIGGRSTDSGSYVVAGLAAESAVSAATLFDAQFGQTWYALVMPTLITDSLSEQVGVAIEAMTNKHIFGVTSNDGAIINNSSDTSNIAYLSKTAGLKRTYVQYSASSAYAIMSAFARILTVNYAGNNTTITLMWKQEPIIAAENLNSTQLATLQGFNANVFAAYNNNTAILESFVDGAGLYADVQIGADNFAIDLQVALYNQLYLSTTKIPQTDAGMHQLATTMKSICIQYVQNEFIAPGIWQAGGFGTLNDGDFMPTGYYIYQPSVASQPQTQRLARISVPFQIAIKLAGAVQTVDVSVTVNQ